ncbi:MAG: hypothetical protein PWR27_989 [Petroclostridium sp.]|jgi:hypothetical protein|uniref:DUF3842 family protein n=1 Tax=Petroclostridium xylanilyticum TaxID=1792311 RepID=UPI000B98FD92|nr:DUF3842 family protein [Petroclostridium xylanilyticum]MBZ4647236.1 hypothetical protein [Clostridia bacterium]MDK2810280.1 hypothetical protein [Petroclostridium sp.]
MKIAVVDGQGGGLGRSIIEKLSKEISGMATIIALGTNSMATASMLKAGANEGGTGENAIVVNANRVDIIVGSVGILAANSMLGEFTPKMAEAVASSSAKKILIPLNRCGLEIVGTNSESLPGLIDLLVLRVKEICNANGKG